MKKYFKIISNSIAYTLRGISYLIPRNKDKWVVGNSRGFNNNTKYFFIHAKTVLEKTNVIGSVKTNHPAKLYGHSDLKHIIPGVLQGYIIYLPPEFIYTIPGCLL